jgi:hypothetical protein
MDWNWNQFSLIKMIWFRFRGPFRNWTQVWFYSEEHTFQIQFPTWSLDSNLVLELWTWFQVTGTRTTSSEPGNWVSTQHQYLPSWDDLEDLVNYLKGIV